MPPERPSIHPAILSACLAAALLSPQAQAADNQPDPQANPAMEHRAPPPEEHEWQRLFADAAWYLQQASPEQEFSGVLEAVPAADSGGLQRTAYYTLAGRAVYTGATRPPPLEALLGKRVDIRGKAVDFPLEGGWVHEIWPASIRRE